MPATLIWGNGFRIEEATLPSGKVYREVTGIDGGEEFLSWSSVEEMESLAEQYGVDRQTWPVYRDCEDESKVPLKEAQERSAALAIALEGMDPRVVQENHWLSFIWRLLRDGNSFFIMV
jgi:hypothetical protein